MGPEGGNEFLQEYNVVAGSGSRLLSAAGEGSLGPKTCTVAIADTLARGISVLAASGRAHEASFAQENLLHQKLNPHHKRLITLHPKLILDQRVLIPFQLNPRQLNREQLLMM